MGHRMPAMGRGNDTFVRGDSVKHKARLKWRKKNGGRFQETQFQAASRRGGGLFLQRHRGHHPPEAPRNTTSYIIRSKSMVEVMAPVVTPSPFTPALLSTRGLSPLPRYKEQFAEEVKEWGVNGYGSMNGLIRMKVRDMSEDGSLEVEEEEIEGQYAQSLQQLEQRLDQDLSRFEMVYPCATDDDDDAKKAPPLEILLVDQEYHIAQLEEENIILRERLSLIEQELGDLRSRMHMLEGGSDHYEPGEVVSEKSIGTRYPSES